MKGTPHPLIAEENCLSPERLGRIQVKGADHTWHAKEIQSSGIHHGLGHDPFNGDAEDSTRAARCRDAADPGIPLVGPLALTFFFRYHRVCELLSADGHVLVDLHWILTSWTFYFPWELARMWDRCTQVTLLGTPTHTLAPEDLLLYLCAHGAKHHWQRLAWSCDMAALLRTYELEWGRLLDQEDQTGGRRMLGRGCGWRRRC
jgi:hypothetical protein